MDIEYLIIGIIFLITGIAIIVYKFRYHTIKENEYADFETFTELEISLILIIAGVYLIYKEIKFLI